ncbi:MAG: hypothetical protein UT77_C0013G0033 [Candidatus Daviesbacteria bacterium GW2011_GWC2_40_12]|uniref:Uncharacterized protein n=1 Tax=Candidatus Daviesbacteria bacterium GW2011_GWC2_40_12 TaxID=1618431 RepID=A0A0G0QMI6_9BACT|nr:MAG: hypothetical protein UT77_C0013G0033 [Candidatus Daviesbacteria bacterium GW2011_GWC2_40_12]
MGIRPRLFLSALLPGLKELFCAYKTCFTPDFGVSIRDSRGHIFTAYPAIFGGIIVSDKGSADFSGRRSRVCGFSAYCKVHTDYSYDHVELCSSQTFFRSFKPDN